MGEAVGEEAKEEEGVFATVVTGGGAGRREGVTDDFNLGPDISPGSALRSRTAATSVTVTMLLQMNCLIFGFN